MTAFKYGLGACFALMMLGLILFQVFPRQLLAMFSASDQMLVIGIPALRLISLCFPAAAVGIMGATFFQATGHGIISLWASLIRQLFGILPLAWLLSQTSDPGTHVWAAFPLAETIGFLYTVIMLRRIYQKEVKTLEHF